jgi:hypothetical protein
VEESSRGCFQGGNIEKEVGMKSRGAGRVYNAGHLARALLK